MYGYIRKDFCAALSTSLIFAALMITGQNRKAHRTMVGKERK